MRSQSRILLDSPPQAELGTYKAESPWHPTSDWPASWLKMPESFRVPAMALFRCRFNLSEPALVRLHVTADERYELYLDGEFVGSGSERGDGGHWYYETYEMPLVAGTHVVVARVWALGVAGLAPWAQVSVEPGFFCCPEAKELQPVLATGRGEWECRVMTGCGFREMSLPGRPAMGVGPNEILDGNSYPWGWEAGIGGDWEAARVGEPGFHGFAYFSTRPIHWLRPSLLPPMDGAAWDKYFHVRSEVYPLPTDVEDSVSTFLRGGQPLMIPAHTRRELVIDLEDYVCAYPFLSWMGGEGGSIALGWSEALRDPDSGEKVRGGDFRRAIFEGPEDEIALAGGDDVRHWRSHWWRCGRFIKLTLTTREVPLVLQSLSLEETRYPFPSDPSWEVSEPALHEVFALCQRSWQLCAHDAYLDCPYYEQLMYVGDARIQALLTYALSDDDRLARKALQLLDFSRTNPTGLVTASHPSGGGQLIPPFALWWVAMVFDYARWRGDRVFIRSLLPGVRSVLDHFVNRLGASGALRSPEGWNFLDWSFEGGVPPGSMPGECGAAYQAQLILALQQATALENYAGCPIIGRRWARLEDEVAGAWDALFWDEARGLFANDVHHSSYSEHGQSLALLTGRVCSARVARIHAGILEAGDLTRVSSYFAHYLFEADFLFNGGTLFFSWIEAWKECVRLGFKTLPETFGETRSDCHAWSAHPLFHYLTGILGIRPGAMGFASVEIRPCVGPLVSASGTWPHPLGPIKVSLCREKACLRAIIELPPGLSGTCLYGATSFALVPGRQELEIVA